MFGVDQPAFLVPVEAERVAVAARKDLGYLLALRRIETKNAGREVSAGEPRTSGNVRMGCLAELADRGLFPGFAVVRAEPLPR